MSGAALRPADEECEMFDYTFRLEENTTDARVDEVVKRVRQGYETYASANPFPNSRHTPPFSVQAIRSPHPYTDHGKVKSMAWLPEGKEFDPWYLGAVKAVMQVLLEEFPDRGVSTRHDSEGSAIKLQPKKTSACAAA